VSTATGRLVEVDRGVLLESFAKTTFPVHHNLVGHPLLELGSIAALSDSLPKSEIEHNLGSVPEVLPGGKAPQRDEEPGEIARGIETNGCWMVLKHIELDDAYAELLERSLEEVIADVADREGGLRRREGFIFLSAPNSTTPAHFDTEHNMLLQIQGTKNMVVGTFPDAETEHTELERYYGGGHRNIDELPANAKTYHLTPGEGVYVPPHAPHMVKNGPETSISLSITFYTRDSERAGRVWSVNSRLRRLGLEGKPPGERPASDAFKEAAWAGLRGVTGAVRGIRRSG
jgi:hypothetical protein